jgi:hypothetical protein
MIEYVRRHLWEDLYPGPDPVRWMAERVMRISPPLLDAHPLDQLIYEALHSIGPKSNSYLNSYNSCRVDLVAEFVDPPIDQCSVEVTVDYYPQGEEADWLSTHVFGFTPDELRALGVVTLQDKLHFLLLVNARCRREIRPLHPVISRWHRVRYLLLRYYLDAKYHVLNN